MPRMILLAAMKKGYVTPQTTIFCHLLKKLLCNSITETQNKTYPVPV
jgi:hypothetical protein